MKKSLFSRFRKTVTRLGNDGEESPQDHQYPTLTSSMLTPVDQPLSTRNALNIYKQHMLAIDFLERDELEDFVARLREEIAEHEKYLKEEVKAAREAVAEARSEARQEGKKLRRLLSKATDDEETGELSGDLEKVDAEMRSAQDDLAVASAELATFKKDKRDFLINYINTEVHGSHWKNT